MSKVEMLRDEAYVPFDIHFSDQDGRGKVITGPNMAGKSSCVRATVSTRRFKRNVLKKTGSDRLYGSDWIFRTGVCGEAWYS